MIFVARISKKKKKNSRTKEASEEDVPEKDELADCSLREAHKNSEAVTEAFFFISSVGSRWKSNLSS